jgi:hypothetical protein
MFENIDNNYIVIGLIVLTLVCIYLLYNSLNSGGDSIELKKHINELVLQNKKRDEIIHFLVNQVQLLQSQPPITEITTHEPFVNDNTPTTEPLNTDINTDDMHKLDELLEADFPVKTDAINETDDVVADNTDDGRETVDEGHETVDEGHETDEVVADNTDDGHETSGSSSEEEALINSVLSNDKLPPKDKDLLYVYTVSQLKDYAKELNISAGGNKDTLINRIYNAL